MARQPSLHNDGMSGGPPRFFALTQLASGTVVVGSCTRGMARSTDRGRTWTPVDGMGHVSINTIVDGPDDQILAATSAGTARSTDDARSWDLIDSVPAYAVFEGGITPPPDVVVHRLLRPRRGAPLAATNGDGIWQWTSPGWEPLALAGCVVDSLAEAADGTLVAGTRSRGVHRSMDAGQTWQPSSAGLPDLDVHCLWAMPDGSMYAGTGQGLALSGDVGRTWSPVAGPTRNNRIFSVTVLDDHTVLAGGYTQLWARRDQQWTAVDPGLTPDEAWSVHAVADGTIVAGAKVGMLRSHDAGHTWVNERPGSLTFAFCDSASGRLLAGGDDGVSEGPRWTPVGRLEPRVYALLEVAPRVLLAGTLGDGLFRLDDEGWHPVDDGPGDPLIYDLMRTSTGRILVGTGAVRDAAKSGGIFASDDGGRTWRQSYRGRSVYHVVEAADGTLYGGGHRCHLLRSDDGGTTWTACPPVVRHEAKTYALHVDGRDRLLLGAGDVLLRSDDGGRSWTPIEEGLDGVTVYDLTEDARGNMVAATSGGLFRTEDGVHWSAGELTESAAPQVSATLTSSTGTP